MKRDHKSFSNAVKKRIWVCATWLNEAFENEKYLKISISELKWDGS